MHRYAAWLRRKSATLPIQQLLTGIGGTAVVVSGLFGGLDTVESITTVQPGEEFSDGNFTWDVLSASLSGKSYQGFPNAKEGRRYLDVLLKVRNDSTAPAMYLDKGVELRDLPHAKHVSLFRASDPMLTTSLLGPGLTDTMVFEWDLPQDAVQPGGNVTLRAWRKKLADSLLNVDGDIWLTSSTTGTQVTLIVDAA